MKRILFFLVIISGFLPKSNAQDITDALRYSTENIIGTARFNALGGAFGTLGGDLSAISINPAGSAVFLKNAASVSLNISDVTNKASYFSTKSNVNFTNTDFNQAGFVFVFNTNNQESDWNKFTVGLNFETSQNFDQNLFVKGVGDTSIGDFFVQQAQGVPLDLLQLQGGETISDLYSYLGENFGTSYQNAFLGYQGFIFDPVDANDTENTLYTLTIAGGDFNQEYSFITRGFNAKYSFNLATQYRKKLYFGINLNSHTIDYLQYTFLEEHNNNNGSTVNYVGFENTLQVLGNGFSAQAGIIAKITPEFRVSATYNTPTWLTISEETTQYLETNRISGSTNILTTVNPNVVNLFKDYKLQTPGKLSAGIAYVFGSRGLVSLNYEYKDYSKSKFKPQTESYFATQNTLIGNTLKATSTIRFGGEYKYERWSFRGGLRFEESPYKDNNVVGDTTVLSTGVGYDFGGISVDVSYSNISQTRNQQLYNIGLTSTSAIDSKTSTFVLTLGYNL